MEDPQFWKQIWDFFKSVVSNTLAPWINRLLPHLISPTVRMVRTHTPAVRRVAGNQARDVLAPLRGMPQHLRNPWLWPVFLAIPVGIGMETTQWGATVELAGGAQATVYLCVAAFLIVKSRLR
jgi:hypothetical protein